MIVSLIIHTMYTVACYIRSYVHTYVCIYCKMLIIMIKLQLNHFIVHSEGNVYQIWQVSPRFWQIYSLANMQKFSHKYITLNVAAASKKLITYNHIFNIEILDLVKPDEHCPNASTHLVSLSQKMCVCPAPKD